MVVIKGNITFPARLRGAVPRLVTGLNRSQADENNNAEKTAAAAHRALVKAEQTEDRFGGE